jgi:hypothetical protein
LWARTFSADNQTDHIATLLDRFPDLRNLMNSLVPEKVSYQDFWKRYLYRKAKIEAGEARRKQLFESKEDENDFDWDGDDDVAEVTQASSTKTKNPSLETPKRATNETHPESAPRKSSTSESSTSFDMVSLSSANPQPSNGKVRLHVRMSNYQLKTVSNADESDDDWE